MYQVPTPEGVDLQAHLAGPMVRILAYLIDFSIRAGVYLLALIVLAILGDAGSGLLLVVAFLLEWFYPVFFEVRSRGQTPGKKMMNIAVVNDELGAVDWNASLTRNLLRTADFLPFGFLTGLVFMTTSQGFKRLGDMAAGTLVIYQYSRPASNDLPDVPVQVPGFLPDLTEQEAITNFALRQQNYSDERKAELADILQAQTGLSGKAAVDYLLGIGRWLMGDRR